MCEIAVQPLKLARWTIKRTNLLWFHLNELLSAFRAFVESASMEIKPFIHPL